MRRFLRKRRVLVLAVVVIALAGLAIILWPGPANSLRLYTSPPIRMAGKTSRVQMLVPAGWSVKVEQNGGPIAPPCYHILSAKPAQRLAWLPAFYHIDCQAGSR